MDFNPEEEDNTPINKMEIHTNLNLTSFTLTVQPMQPETTYAAASGAVIALVIPAENNPIAKIYLELTPNKGSIPFAKSAALSILSIFNEAY